MFSFIAKVFNIFLYEPLYNGLIFLIDLLDFLDVGIVIVIFTIIIKLILFPLSKKSIITQLTMKRLEPEMNLIRDKYKDDKQQQAQKIMEFYKNNDLNPFSGIILIFIQLPILLALYWVFLRAGLPDVNTDLLYSFVSVPSSIDMNFLGIILVSSKDVILAVIAAIAQYFQIKLSMPNMETPKDQPRSMSTDIAKGMQMQMKYVFPLIILFIAYQYTAVIALYLITSALMAIGQELFIKRKLVKKYEVETVSNT